jgi:6-phosphogluconate dehydrogenase
MRCAPWSGGLLAVSHVERGVTMEIGIAGLGKMGSRITGRLLDGGHGCVVFNRHPEKAEVLVAEGAKAASSLDELVAALKPPRVVWVMVPAGDPTESVAMELAGNMEAGDVIIDGGNSYFKDDVRRSKAVKQRGIHYVDIGTSGGVWGRERGFCLMIGGEDDVVKRLDPIFKTLAPGKGDISRTSGREKVGGTAEEGYLHCGPSGAGHFVKMVHNGIEYGLMQAYAEGFDILRNANSEGLLPGQRYDIKVADVAEVWRRGSIIGSWLLDLVAAALIEDPGLSSYEGVVQDSGEGRWMVMTAIEEAVPVDAISAALYARFRSRREHTFAEKVLSAMRKKFGGHLEPHPPGRGKP